MEYFKQAVLPVALFVGFVLLCIGFAPVVAGWIVGS